MTRPKILVTLDTGQTLRRGVPFPSVHMKAAYVDAIEKAGGTPILASPTENAEVISELAATMDGLVITGGAFDIDPATYGMTQTAARIDTPKPTRTRFEWSLLESAIAAHKPVLGICGGMQLLNVVRGGTLIQDIPSEVEGALEHEQPHSPAQPAHDVIVEPGTAFAALVGAPTIAVNTTHHQAVAALGKDLLIFGRSTDGVIEAIGDASLRLLGVQWHPELLADSVSDRLYQTLVRGARKNTP